MNNLKQIYKKDYINLKICLSIKIFMTIVFKQFFNKLKTFTKI